MIPLQSQFPVTDWNKIEMGGGDQYLIIKCIFLIYVVTIATESCYLSKLDLVKVTWDLPMVGAVTGKTAEVC